MKLLKNILAGSALVLFANTAQAALAQIQMSGLNLTYNEATGNLDATNDSLITMTFLVDGNPIGVLTNPPTSLTIDLHTALPDGTDPTINGSTLLDLGQNSDFFDIFAGLNSLLTNITSGSVEFTNLGVNITGTGFSDIFSQDLPFGLVAENPINWSLSAGLGSCTGGDGERICTYSGTPELAWETSVPEPATLLLLGIGLLGLSATRLRRRT